MAPANPADPKIAIPFSKPARRGRKVRKDVMAHESHAATRQLPADLSAPAFVDGWKSRALMIGVVFSVIAAGLAFADGSIEHVLRAWALGMTLTFGFSVGGLAMLMVQYCSGGKWGLLLRRPLEAMSRTLPLVFIYWLVVAFEMKRLYLWAQYTTVSATAEALKAGLINEVQAHCMDFKRPMLNPFAFVWVSCLCFAIWGFYSWRLNCAGLEERCRFAGQHALLDQEVREHQRAGHRGVLHNHDGGGYLLGDVDGPDVVLVGIRPAFPGGTGIWGAGVLNHRGALAF